MLAYQPVCEIKSVTQLTVSTKQHCKAFAKTGRSAHIPIPPPIRGHRVTLMILKIKKNSGSAVIEFIIAGIVFCLILAGAFQMMLLYEGHVRLQQAAFEAARHGIVNNGTAAAIKKGFIQNSLDLYIHGTKPEDILKAYKLSQKAVNYPLTEGGAGVVVTRLNPTPEAFEDFAIEKNNKKFIPNAWLHMKSDEIGENSQLSIQDANILKIKIKYGFPLEVPVIDKIIGAILTAVNPANQHYYKSTPVRMPLSVTTVMHMQSDVYE